MTLSAPEDPPPLSEAPARRRGPDRLPRTSLFVAVLGVISITLVAICAATVVLLKARGEQSPDGLNGLIGLAGVGMGSLGTFLARGQGNT